MENINVMQEKNTMMELVLVRDKLGPSTCEIVADVYDVTRGVFLPYLRANGTLYETENFKPIGGGQKVAGRYIDDFYKVNLPLAHKVFLDFVNDLQGVAHKKDSYHKAYNDIIKVLEKGIYPLIIGPSGSGKSFLGKQLAQYFNVPYYFTNAVSDPVDLTGYMDMRGQFVEKPFYKAFKEGGLFLFDEVDASDNNALLVVNEALANGVMTFPNGEQVQAHEKFYCIASANTFGTGASIEYVGRNVLDAATLDRFGAVIIAGYDEAIEKLCANNDSELVDFCHAWRKACVNIGIKNIFSYRGIGNIASLANSYSDSELYKVLQMCLVKSIRHDNLRQIVENIGITNKYTEAIYKVIDIMEAF